MKFLILLSVFLCPVFTVAQLEKKFAVGVGPVEGPRLEKPRYSCKNEKAVINFIRSQKKQIRRFKKQNKALNKDSSRLRDVIDSLRKKYHKSRRDTKRLIKDYCRERPIPAIPKPPILLEEVGWGVAGIARFYRRKNSCETAEHANNFLIDQERELKNLSRENNSLEKTYTLLKSNTTKLRQAHNELDKYYGKIKAICTDGHDNPGRGDNEQPYNPDEGDSTTENTSGGTDDGSSTTDGLDGTDGITTDGLGGTDGSTTGDQLDDGTVTAVSTTEGTSGGGGAGSVQ